MARRTIAMTSSSVVVFQYKICQRHQIVRQHSGKVCRLHRRQVRFGVESGHSKMTVDAVQPLSHKRRQSFQVGLVGRGGANLKPVPTYPLSKTENLSDLVHYFWGNLKLINPVAAGTPRHPPDAGGAYFCPHFLPSDIFATRRRRNAKLDTHIPV